MINIQSFPLNLSLMTMNDKHCKRHFCLKINQIVILELGAKK